MELCIGDFFKGMSSKSKITQIHNIRYINFNCQDEFKTEMIIDVSKQICIPIFFPQNHLGVDRSPSYSHEIEKDFPRKTD